MTTMLLPDPRQKPWLTVAELAQITGEGEKAIRAALNAGQLPRIDIGRYVRIPTAALLALLGIAPENTEAGPASPATANVPPLALLKTTGDTRHGHPAA